MSEYLKDQTLVGKRARFKDNLPGYVKELWLQKGVIIQHKGLEHIGISLKFDNPEGLPLDTCYIMPGSIELLDKKEA